LQRIIKQYDLKIGNDYKVLTPAVFNPKGGRPAKDYRCTIDMAWELSMVEHTEKGHEVRK